MEDETKSTISEKQFEELKAEMANDTKAVVEEVLKSNVPSQRLPMDTSDEDKKAKDANGKFKSFGEFAQSIYQKSVGGGDDPRLKALNEGSGEAGGFLVPEEYRNELLKLAVEDAVIRPRAKVIPMASNTVTIPTVKDTSHASSIHGGVIAYWAEEAGSYTASEPDFGQLQLTAKKLTGYTQASDELVADSAIALESLLVGMFGDAIRFYEDKSFINGTGAGDPLGILNSDALISVSKETGQAATTIVYENLVKMYSRMFTKSHNNTVWLAHPDTLPQLMTMALNVGTGGSAIWINNAAEGVPATIFGRPVILSEHMKTLGTVGDIMYCDLSYYVIGDRMGVSIASSPHYRFANGETVWRFTERIDGAPWLDSAVTPEQGSNTLSPFVALATRS
tara:strand:+ start:1649 stop:2830 length:1182 start_codon:yes stop_codon:yes gene_type:complete